VANFEKDLSEAQRRFHGSRRERDELIVKAVRSGLSRRRIAALTGLSHQRVQQIVQEAKR
jgi:transposase-like protein